MKLIKSSYEILDQKPGIQGIYEQIELAGRTCYKSERKEGTTAKDFVDKMIASKHYSMLEHGTVYLKIPNHMSTREYLLLDFFYRNKYSIVKEREDGYYITTNYRVVIENPIFPGDRYKSYTVYPTEFHEKRVTVRFTTSNGIMREFTRHRVMSFAVESTRYCNYSKDRFNNELTFIQPFWMKEEMLPEEASRYVLFRSLLEYAETTYLSMIKSGMKPQEAREVLPLATKCDMVMTGLVSDWQHFFGLRVKGTTGQPHPDAKVLAEPLYEEFKYRGLL